MTKLYKLAERYNVIEGMLDSDIEGITKEEIHQTLANIKDEFEEKVFNIGKLVLELKSDAESIKVEEERLARRRLGATSKMEWLKNYLLTEMTSSNILKVKRDVVTVSVRNNPPSVEVESLDLLPVEYIRIIPEIREADKKAILEHFKQTGEIVPGVDVITSRRYVEVR